MGHGERASAAELGKKIMALMGALAGLPSIRTNSDALGSLDLVKADFSAFVDRFLKVEGGSNA